MSVDPSQPEEQTYDVIVLGGGPAGENLAQYAIDGSGLSAVLVERELLGGECSYYACMPSKALLGPVEVARTTAHLPGLRPATLDPEALLARVDALHDELRAAREENQAIDEQAQRVRAHVRPFSQHPKKDVPTFQRSIIPKFL